MRWPKRGDAALWHPHRGATGGVEAKTHHGAAGAPGSLVLGCAWVWHSRRRRVRSECDVLVLVDR